MHFRRIFAALILLTISSTLQAADYRTEYDKKIKASQNVGVLGDGLAGDSVNFYTGSTGFNETDLSIPGNNGLSVAIGRSYSVENNHQVAETKGNVSNPSVLSTRLRAFGDWDLEVPHISTVMTQSGWTIDSTTPNNRCSVVGQLKLDGSAVTGAPGYAAKQMPAVGNYAFPAGDYWHGYDMHVGGGSQSLLTATLPNTQRPTTGGPYHWTTNQNWWVSCLPSTANAAGGQGFLAISPGGTKYWFNWLSKRKIDNISYYDDLGGLGTNRNYLLFRAEYLMLATRVEDRFGNWVQYSWSNDEFAKLNNVTSSDGRAITLAYNAQGLVSSVTEATVSGSTITPGSRNWQYTYTANTVAGVTSYNLTQVTLPDSSTWKYNFAALTYRLAQTPYCANPIPPPQIDWACFGGGVNVNAPAAVDVTHPSGAKVEFTFNEHFQISGHGQGYSWPLGIVSKRISGPGLTAATWQYAFAPSRENAATACQAGTCPTRIVTDQIDPDGSISRRIFAAVAIEDESMLLGELEGKLEPTLPSGGSQQITCSPRWGCGDIMDDPTPGSTTVPVFYRELSYTYVPATETTNYVVRVGVNPLTVAPANDVPSTYASERRLPVKQEVTTQQGVNFTWQAATDASCGYVMCFDIYGNPTRVTRFSTGNAGGDSTRTEITTYAHDTAKWPAAGSVDTILS